MITFIIPSIGRDSLVKTINSLFNQSNPNWKAIIIFDGCKPIEFKDPRIKGISVEKCGKGNHAGDVRNIGLEQVDTEWIGFVDDDDTLSRDYVKRFEEEVALNPDAGCVIFRMRNNINGWKIMPAPEHDNFYLTKVGISFAMRKDLDMKFESSSIEDFIMLQSIRNKKVKMIISPHVTYFVNSLPVATQQYKRVVI